MAAVSTALFYLVLLNLFLGMFNLLPIPPFDGSHIVGGLLPDSLRGYWLKLQQVGMVLLIGLIAASWAFGTDWIAQIVMPPVLYVAELFLPLDALGLAI
jgi:Zn-dependent protease